MNSSGHPPLTWLFDRMASVVSMLAIIVGLVVLALGWALDIVVLKSVVPGLTPMKANTAIEFILAGISLWTAVIAPKGRLLGIVSKVFALGVFLIGFASLWEYLIGADLGIDQFLFQDVTNYPGDIPGRMAENTAVCFVFLGGAMLLLEAGKNSATIHFLTLAAMLIAGAAFVNYAYGLEELMRIRLKFTPMSLPTSALLFFIGLGILCARPDFPLRRFMTSSTTAGTVVRHLLPTAVVFTFAFGWLMLRATQAGFFSFATATAAFAMAVAGCLGFMILLIASRLYKSDMLRELAEEKLRTESALVRQSKELLSLFIENSPVALAMFDREMIYMAISPRWKIDYGLGEQNVIGRSHYEIFPEIPERWKALHRRGMEGEILRAEEDKFVRENGTVQWLQWEIWPWRKADGSVGGIVLVSEDITERKLAQDELRRAALEIEDLYNHAPCGYHSLDKDGVFVRINDTELSWLGYGREEVVGKMGWRDVVSPGSLGVLDENFPIFLRQGFVRDLEFEMVRKDGTTFIGLVNAVAAYDENGNYLSSRSVLLDITERRMLQAKLEQQARIDSLTGLNNRRYFLELAEHELSRSRRFNEPLALLMLDIDHFKKINDSYGHDIGDAVLREFGACCRDTLREIDISGRLGGEEFVVLLPGIDGQNAIDAAERLRFSLSEKQAPAGPGKKIDFTVSVGVADRIDAEDTVEAMLKRADAALYDAKNAGRNCVRRAAAQ